MPDRGDTYSGRLNVEDTLTAAPHDMINGINYRRSFANTFCVKQQTSVMSYASIETSLMDPFFHTIRLVGK